MPRRAAVLAVLLLSILAPGAAAAGLPGTQRTLAREMSAAGPYAGAYVADLTTGQVLYTDNPDARRVPASVNKLFTTSTALERFGPDATLHTDLLAQSSPDASGVLQGDVYLRGGGDPTFTTSSLRTMARAVAAEGITSIAGRVIGDETAWDALRGGPASSFRTSYWVGPLSALTLDRGFVGRHFQINPPLTAAKALTTQLRKAGVRVAGKPRTGVTPTATTQLATRVSPSIAQIVAMTNTPSDNFLAESLLKAIGAAFGGGGSTAAGATVVRSTVATLGAHPRYVDGSGLSRRDWTSPHEVVNLIATMDRSPLAVPFEASLPVAGRTGTLKDRMRHVTASSRCHAKTGTLTGVSSLAGYCDAVGGHRIAFAFLMNHASVYWSHVHQDRMTNALALYTG